MLRFAISPAAARMMLLQPTFLCGHLDGVPPLVRQRSGAAFSEPRSRTQAMLSNYFGFLQLSGFFAAFSQLC
jgi:hypothetical protein